MRLVYGGWEPDKPPFLSDDGLQVATNTYPSSLGYSPVGQLAAVSIALPAEPLGAAAFPGSAVIAGTATDLYKLAGSAWTSLHSGYGATRWRFVQFGNIAIATNGVDPMQRINLSTYAVTALGGSPPTATMLAVVKDFVLAGVINGSRNTVKWSAINNAEAWTAGTAQCDFQIMANGGDVTGLFGGDYGIVLQRTRMSRMIYVGGNLVFEFQEVSNNIGCVTANSVVQAGEFGFFLSDTGFMMWTGTTLVPIGKGRVDKTFQALYGDADFANMSAAVDLKNALVTWTMPERTFVYNWMLDRWSLIEQPASFSFSGNASGDPVFYVFDSSYLLGSFSGGPMEAVFQTASLEPVPGRETRISTLRPLTDAEFGISLSVASLSRLSDDLVDNDYVDISDNGDMPVRECGRYLRLTQRIAPESNWTYVLGADLVDAKPGAKR